MNKITNWIKGHKLISFLIAALIIPTIPSVVANLISEPSATPIITFTLFLCVLIFAAAQFKKRQDGQMSDQRMRLIAEANAFVDAVKSSKALPIITSQSSLLLDKDEHLILAEQVFLRETRAVRHSGGGFASMRIMKGVRIGRYMGSSSSTQEWAAIDSGSLFLTNKKLVFMGGKENRSMALKHIVALQTFLDAISVTLDTRGKAIQFPVRNPYIWATSVNIAKSVADPFHLDELALDIKLQ